MNKDPIKSQHQDDQSGRDALAVNHQRFSVGLCLIESCSCGDARNFISGFTLVPKKKGGNPSMTATAKIIQSHNCQWLS